MKKELWGSIMTDEGLRNRQKDGLRFFFIKFKTDSKFFTHETPAPILAYTHSD